MRGNAEEVDAQRSDSHGFIGQVTVLKLSQELQANIKRLFKQRDEAFRFCILK